TFPLSHPFFFIYTLLVYSTSDQIIRLRELIRTTLEMDDKPQVISLNPEELTWTEQECQDEVERLQGMLLLTLGEVRRD
ncbi:MAG: hypothetical protein Greene07142_445, partial [Parcubacteria group bacterium Greene0714_2]